MSETKFIPINLDSSNYSETDIIKALRSIGKISQDFTDTKILIKLSQHLNKDIRYYAILNLAKLSNDNLLEIYEDLITKEKTSRIRREITSAIGRLRSEKAIPLLISLLQDKDPNVILQSIRGLLVFKKNKTIFETLMKLQYHKNELVRNVVEVEFFDDKQYQKEHQKSPDHMKNTVIFGDVLNTLEKTESESIHLTFTSPPYYNARDYSIYDSYDSYINFLKKVFREVFRITKEGRFFVLNTSPIIIPRVGRKYSSKRYPIPYDIHPHLINQGWEFIDDIIWMKPEPSVKNRVAGFDMHRKPLAYKPNSITECLMVYRKKSNKLIDWIYKQYPEKILQQSKITDDYETNNVWKIDPRSDRVHSAIFPQALCEKVIQYYSFQGDLIFDPFAGSGSVGIAAKKLNRDYFLTENNETYYNDIIKKLENTQGKLI